MNTRIPQLFPANIMIGLVLALLICPRSIATPAEPATFNGIAQIAKYAPAQPNVVLTANVQINRANDMQAAADNQWYRIPKWFAGTWRRQSITTLRELDCRTGLVTENKATIKAQSHDQEGWQQDSQGNCWNHDHTPFRTEALSDTYKQVFIVQRVTPLQVSEEQVTKEFIGNGVLIDNSTGKVKYSAKARSVHTYAKHGDGHIICRSVITEYDPAGKEIRVTNTQSEYERVSEFHPHDTYSGVDMRAAFRNFLLSRGNAHLIPNSIAMSL